LSFENIKFVNFNICHCVSLKKIYILDLLGKMLMKIWFIRKVHNKLQIDKEKKHWKGVRQITRYKQTKTLKGCKINKKILANKEKNIFEMEVDLWWIIIRHDHGIVVMTITKIPILHKPIPMKHQHWNYYEIWLICFVCPNIVD